MGLHTSPPTRVPQLFTNVTEMSTTGAESSYAFQQSAWTCAEYLAILLICGTRWLTDTLVTSTFSAYRFSADNLDWL